MKAFCIFFLLVLTIAFVSGGYLRGGLSSGYGATGVGGGYEVGSSVGVVTAGYSGGAGYGGAAGYGGELARGYDYGKLSSNIT
ncbi:glycine-rich protein 2-like [Anoplophora glabripennis]|uniref:glycine-rich protein 2-like n=1 Tax=Anoplophora glabripennis TaxID=217634 RepID=UPI000875776E|nr:glycine-rich protein 2-like [Anoplophora glabripennis]